MKKEQYLIFIDKRFLQYARREMASALGAFSEVLDAEHFMIIETDAGGEAVIGLPDQTVFISNAIPLLGIIDYKPDLSNIADVIRGSMGKGSFRIEAFNTGSKTGQSAKSIEVKIGRELESKGLTADLKDPDTDFYLIFQGDSAYIGKLDNRKGRKPRIMDEFRRSNMENIGKISRAEFKLREAIGYFGIDLKRIGSAIDIGASPGGWSRVLSDKGIKVLAIDKAKLAYSSKLITHIKESADSVGEETLSKFGKADILLIDTNTDPKISSGIAAKFAESLGEGAYLILTLKFVGGSMEKHMNTVTSVLSDRYGSIKMKKLPHNRLEITCFAIKK